MQTVEWLRGGREQQQALQVLKIKYKILNAFIQQLNAARWGTGISSTIISTRFYNLTVIDDTI